MRIVVCAYSEVGRACLDELLGVGADVRLVITHRDAPGENVWFGSVAERARSAGVAVMEPEDPRSPQVRDAIAAARPGLLYSFYYRHMLPQEILDVPTAGALNMHGSLLPRYRGRAPVNWVLVNGERETGVTLHYMDAKPDHGDVVAQRRVWIERDDDALGLTRKLAAAARAVLRDAHPMLAAGRAPRWQQDHSRSTYFGGRRPSDGAIDWRWPAERIRNLVRAVADPWPGAFTALRGERVVVWWAETAPAGGTGGDPGRIAIGDDGVPRVATGDGALELAAVGVGPRAERRSGAQWAREQGLRDGERFDATPADGDAGARAGNGFPPGAAAANRPASEPGAAKERTA